MTRRKRLEAVLSRRTRGAFLRWAPLRKVLLEILGDHGLTGTLGVAVVSDDEIRRLHGEFLREETPTDVITFRLDTPGSPDDTLGEIVVSADTAAREAERRNLRPDAEIALYAIHGALHLAGFDDVAAADRRAMRRGERMYLERYEALLREGLARVR
jgi:probable rRNA maturation factor